MNRDLNRLINRIGEKFAGEIQNDSGLVLEVDLGKQAEKLGYTDLKEKYDRVLALVPLKNKFPGMSAIVDGRTFKDYAQFGSGVVVPGYVAKAAGLPYKQYIARESLVRVLA